MKHLLLLACILFSLNVSAQFTEDFKTSQYPHSPKWRGHTFAFGINSDSLLQSRTINSTYISTENQLAVGVVWEFGIKLAFNPSPANQLRVYLVADHDTLNAPLNGYFIQIGENGSTDRYILYRQEGGQTDPLLSSSPINRIDPNVIEDRIRVVRDSLGNWELFTAIDRDTTFHSEGVVADNRFMTSYFFGINCLFTQANSNGFHFRYFSIDTTSIRIVMPPEPPAVRRAVPLNDSTVLLVFDNLMDSATSIVPENYSLSNGYGHPAHASLNDSAVTLVFADLFTTGNYLLTITGVQDFAGTPIAENTTVSFSYEGQAITETKLLPDDTTGALFYDDFNAGLQNHWTGDTIHVAIIEDRLKIASSAPSPALISTLSNRLRNTAWEVGIDVDGAVTSGNYVRVYLAANDDPAGPHQGYHLQVDGASGNHVYRLWRQNGGIRSTIFQSNPIPNQGNKFRARVRVSCDSDGVWQILADEYDSGIFETVLRNNGDSTAQDGTYTASEFAGYFVNFTTTRREDFKFDYLLVTIHDHAAETQPDSIPPAILSAAFIDDSSIAVKFDKNIDPVSAAIPAHYIVLPVGQYPETVVVTDSIVELSFLPPFSGGEYMLQVSGIQNVDGFAMEADTSIALEYVPPYMAEPFDIIITEIMARPNGVAGLPEQEYIELYNRSEETISLSGWSYHSLTATHQFTAGIIQPGGYLILCRTVDEPHFSPYGNTLGISPWPVLVDGGTTITIRNARGDVIDEVAYHTSWYRDNQKRNGGWSLERISPHAFCLGADNWLASDDSRGGSPGMQNSVYDDFYDIRLEIAGFELVGEHHIQLHFSKDLDTFYANNPMVYQVSNGVGNPQSVEILNMREVLLHFANPLPTGLESRLAVTGIRDCRGESANVVHLFFLPQTMLPGDVLVNEILFNPKADGVDFVEIYNHSDKIFDLQELYLANVNTGGQTANHRQVSGEQFLFYPGEYKVLTTDPGVVQQHYPNAVAHALIPMTSLPAFPNNSGNAVLVAKGVTIDSLSYHATMHSEFIVDPKGVSLERQSFGTPTNAIGNFRSAATAIGGATPGYQNSQAMLAEEEEGVYLTSRTFSPDYDGFEDLLEIKYRFPEGGYMANVDIYNDKGILVRRLQRNQSLATEGVIHWDGTSDTNQRLPVGIYIALIEIYNAGGIRKTFRKSFVMATKF